MLPALSTKPKQGARQVQGLSNDSIDSYSNMPATGVAVATYADNTTARSKDGGGSTARGKKPAANDGAGDGAVLARVLRDRKASGDEELTLKTGDVVKVLSTKRTGYLKCEFNDEEGYVPSSYLEFFDDQTGDGDGGEPQDTARSERKKKKKSKKHKDKGDASENDGARSPRGKSHGEREAAPVTHEPEDGGDVESPRKSKKKKSKKHRKHHDDEGEKATAGDETERKKKKKKKHRRDSSESSDSEDDDSSARRRRRKHRHRRGRDSDSDSSSSTGSSDSSGARRRRRRRRRHSSSDRSESDDNDKRRGRRRHRHRSSGSENEDGGKSTRRDRSQKRDDDSKTTARKGEAGDKATARDEAAAASSKTAASTTSTAAAAANNTATAAATTAKESKTTARGKDDESRAEASASKASAKGGASDKQGGGLGNKIGEKMRSLLGGGKKSERGTKSSGGILNACPNTVQGEEGWYEHGENERYYFILADGKWSLLYGPMTEDDFELYCQKVMDQGRSVELPPTYLHKSGFYLNSEFRVHKAAS